MTKKEAWLPRPSSKGRRKPQKLRWRFVLGTVSMVGRSTYEKDKPIPKPRPPPIDTLLEDSSHLIHYDYTDSRYKCKVCRSSMHYNATGVRDWVLSKCVKPIIHNPANAAIRIGNLSTHVSHKLFIHRGLIVCNKCGCGAEKVLQPSTSMCSAYPWW